MQPGKSKLLSYLPLAENAQNVIQNAIVPHLSSSSQSFTSLWGFLKSKGCSHKTGDAMRGAHFASIWKLHHLWPLQLIECPSGTDCEGRALAACAKHKQPCSWSVTRDFSDERGILRPHYQWLRQYTPNAYGWSVSSTHHKLPQLQHLIEFVRNIVSRGFNCLGAQIITVDLLDLLIHCHNFIPNIKCFLMFSSYLTSLHPGKIKTHPENGGLEDDVTFQLGDF